MPTQSDKELKKLFDNAIKKIRKLKVKRRWYKEVYDSEVISTKNFMKYFWGKD